MINEKEENKKYSGAIYTLFLISLTLKFYIKYIKHDVWDINFM